MKKFNEMSEQEQVEEMAKIHPHAEKTNFIRELSNYATNYVRYINFWEGSDLEIEKSKKRLMDVLEEYVQERIKQSRII